MLNALFAIALLAAPEIYGGSELYPDAISGVSSDSDLHLNDDVDLTLGNTSAAPDAKILWDTSGTHQLQIWLTDCDGGGSDCVPLYWLTGTDDAVMSGNLNVTGNAVAAEFQGPGTSSRLDLSVDGYALLTDDAGSTFTGLRFGGTTNAYPMLKRFGANIDFRLADDSAYTSVTIYRAFVDVGGVSATSGGEDLNLYTTNYGSGTTATGDLVLKTGAQTNAGDIDSGDLSIYSGDTTTDGDTGAVRIYSGVAGAGQADAGDVRIGVHGDNGDLVIDGATGNVSVTNTLTSGVLNIPNTTTLPATCTTGDQFQDTDSDDCADTGGGDGALCQCKTTNTWILVKDL